MSLFHILVPTFINQLQALAGQIDKGIAHAGGSGDGLLAARLAPDMHPLSSQIKFCCAQATDAIAQLLGQSISITPDVSTMAEAKALIAETIAGLKGSNAAAVDASASRPIALDLPNGMAFDLSGSDYARDWALPQFYFHVTMAYALLRHSGVAIGKADLVPHMFAHLRKPIAS